MQRLNATSFQRRMGSGRTKPCLFFCEDESGENSGEYVVKLKEGMEMAGRTWMAHFGEELKWIIVR